MNESVRKILQLAQQTENLSEKNAYITAASIVIEESQKCTADIKDDFRQPCMEGLGLKQSH